MVVLRGSGRHVYGDDDVSTERGHHVGWMRRRKNQRKMAMVVTMTVTMLNTSNVDDGIGQNV